MAPVLKVLEFLRIIRIAAKRFPGRCSSLLAILGRKLNKWWRLWLEKFRRPKPADHPFRGTEASVRPVSGGSAVVSEYVVAASHVPASASASQASLHGRRPVTVGVHIPVQATLSADPHYLYPPGGGGDLDRSFGNPSVTSIQSRASADRRSIITNSRESMRAPAEQSSRLPRGTHRQFGRGPGLDPSRSRERPTRPPTPTTRPNTPIRPPSITTSLRSSTRGGDRASPVVQSPASSFTHEPWSRPPMHENRRRQSTMMAVDVQNPSTDSLPSINPARITDEPFAIDSPTVHSSESSAVDVHLERHHEPVSPTSSIHSTAAYSLPEGRFVQLIQSEQIPRYEKNATIPRVETAYDVKPLTTKFPYFPEPDGFEQDLLQQDCYPWTPATHPDGALYFYDEGRRLFTDTDMHSKTMRDEIEDFYHYLQLLIHNDQLSIPSKNYDLVMDIMVTDDDDKRISWSYYYACHEARCLFWLETYDASFTTSEVFGVKSPAHVKHRLEALYWNHWSLFPVVFDNRHVPPVVYDELMGMLMHGCVDVITSKNSTFPYDNDTMRRMIRLVQAAKDAGGGLAYYIAGTTRLLSFFAHWRFLYFHGQRHARLIRDQTVYDKPKRERSLLITFLSPLLFLAPEVHIREMERLWTDEVIIETVWKTSMSKLLEEWERVILWSTVMLTANVGFLAIPGVVISNISGTGISTVNQVVIFTSASQIASSLSVEASIGSIMIGLLLVRHNRTKQQEDPSGASTYLYQNCHRIFGLEPMAIIFSLPWALLMWSMVMFFIALLLFCFSISNTLTRIFVAISSVTVVVLVGGCIWTDWESTENDEIWKISVSVFQRTRGDLSERIKGFISSHPRHIPEHNNIPLTDQQGEVRV